MTTPRKKVSPRAPALAADACPRCGTIMKEAHGVLRLPVNGEDIAVPHAAHLRCPKCHAANYVRPNVTLYQELMPYLAMGDAPDRTPIIRKMANLRAIAPDRPTHPGGQRCQSLEAEPCASIIRWWQVEFGPR